jgi:hypothetical protein
MTLASGADNDGLDWTDALLDDHALWRVPLGPSSIPSRGISVSKFYAGFEIRTTR